MRKQQTKRGRGRPAVGGASGSVQIATRYPPEMVDEINAEAARHLDRPTVANLIRQLVAEALEARRSRRGSAPARER